ncbi:MAG: phospholipase D family protein, partial [Rhodanobacter sp.]
MMRLIENQQDLAEWVRQQKEPLDLAVAFWGEGAIEELGLDKRKGKFRVLLDLSAGATNPKVVKALLKLSPEGVKCVPRFHAKAYIATAEMVVGSANASANGLGSEGTEAKRWHELGVICDDAAAVVDAKRWFKNLWGSAEPISPGILKRAVNAWDLMQKTRPRDVTDETNILAAALADPARFTGLGWFVVVTTSDLSKKGNKDAAELKT